MHSIVLIIILFNLMALAVADSPATTDSYYLHSGDWTLPTESTEQIYTIQTIVPTSEFFTCTGTYWSDCAEPSWAHSYSYMRSYIHSFSRCDEMCTGKMCSRCWSVSTVHTLASPPTTSISFLTSVLPSSDSTATATPGTAAASTGASAPSITIAPSVSLPTSTSALAASTAAANDLQPVLIGVVGGGILAELFLAA